MGNSQRAHSRRAFYSPAEVANQLGVDVESVRRWIRRDWLRATKLGHKTIRIAPADLNAFLAAHRVGMGRPRKEDAKRVLIPKKPKTAEKGIEGHD